MMKKATLFKICTISALAFFIGLVAVLASINPITSSKYSGTKSSSNGFVSTGGSSELYKLEVDEKSLAFRVVDKLSNEVVLESGNILPDGNGYDNGLNNTWENFAKSAVTVYYTNEKMYTPLTGFEAVDIEVEEISNGFQARINIDDIQLRFALKVELVGDSVEVTIPFSSINEKHPERNPLLGISVYPFLNSTRGVQQNATDSYIFLPDGSGALIDTSKKSTATNFYQARVYGDDYGVIGNAGIKKSGGSRPPKSPLFPVFGMVNGGKGYMGEIVSGDEYANIVAYASGITTDYNFVYSQFIYREKYFKPIDNAGNTVSTTQTEINKTDARVRYTVLKGEDANYSGMANKYRESLEKRKVFTTAVSGAVPIKADFLMADSYESTFGRTVVPVTSAPFALSAIESLKSSGVKRISSGIIGYTNMGKTGAAPNHSNVGSKTGSKSEYKSLFSYSGANVYPVANYMFVDNEISSYSKRDLVLSMGKEFIEFPDYDRSVFDYSDLQTLHPKAAKNYLDKDIEKFKKDYGINGIQLKGMDVLLSSFNDNKFTRSESKSAITEMVKSAGVATNIDTAPVYLWDSVKEFATSPLDNSMFIIALESVPFLQMATGKYMEHYSPYVNLDYSGKGDLVKMVDYNVNLSYILTEKNSFELCFTPSSRVFSSEFSLWGERLRDTYLRVEPVLSATRGSAFLKREKLAEGVFKNTYENGAIVLVNYTNTDYNKSGIMVKALDFNLGGSNG